jgi:hypothetical protein
MIEACDDTGEAAKKLEPVVRLIECVGAAIGCQACRECSTEAARAEGAKRIEHEKALDTPF